MKDFSKKLFLIMLALLPCFSTTLLAGEGTSDDPEEIPLKPEYPENPPPPTCTLAFTFDKHHRCSGMLLL